MYIFSGQRTPRQSSAVNVLSIHFMLFPVVEITISTNTGCFGGTFSYYHPAFNSLLFNQYHPRP